MIRSEIRRILERDDHEVEAVGGVPDARAVGLDTVDLVITDLRLPGPSGDVLLEEVDGTPVVVITAHGSVRSAVDDMRRGAADYLTKPFEPDELSLVVSRVIAQSTRARTRAALKDEVDRHWNTSSIVGSSPPMREVLRRVEKVAHTLATVLVLGESGTGKELVARAIHDRSERADGPFVPVNCAAIPEALFESELFGHERGAFTGATSAKKGLFRAAQGGTLFLDEIGEMDPSSQARLLRAIQDRAVRPVGASRAIPVDVRLVCATNRDLHAEVEEGNFRRDLLYRIGVLEIRLPPLRERGADRILLARTFLESAAATHRQEVPELSEAAVEAIESYGWPGNVRELENAIERALILHEEGPIDVDALGLPDAMAADAPDDTSLLGYFRRFVEQHQERLSETELAKRLGISRKTLWERRKKLDLPRPSKRGDS